MRYLILWWLNQVLYGALFDDEVKAESAARIRNAVYMELPDGDEKPKILDYWRRDKDGKALSITWYDLDSMQSRRFPPGRIPGSLV